MGQSAKSRPIVFYIRHGETDWNVTGRLQGRHDVPLNARGRAQAMHCGEILRELFARDGRNAAELDFVSSPLGRARTTMELARAPLGLPRTAIASSRSLRKSPSASGRASRSRSCIRVIRSASLRVSRTSGILFRPVVKVIRRYPCECANGTRGLRVTRSLSRTAAPRAGSSPISEMRSRLLHPCSISRKAWSMSSKAIG